MILLTPGPVNVPEDIRLSMAEPTLHHRTPEFEAIFARVRDGLKSLFGMPENLMFASTGSGAMEACVTNLTQSKTLVINGGKFGERFSKIAKAHGIAYYEIIVPWGEACSVEAVESVLKNDAAIDSLCIQISESSTGVRHPVEAIAKMAKTINPNIMVIADGITAVGVESIDVSSLDALITGSQKAMMLPPGLAMVGFSEKAVEKFSLNPKGFYFNLATELKNQRKNTTAWTAATTLIIGLDRVLKGMFEQGLDNVYEKNRKLAYATRHALESIGLKQYPCVPALSMTTIAFEGANGLRKILKNDYGVNIAGGQDELNDKIFRINHMGHVDVHEALWAVQSIEAVLSKMGQRPFDGCAGAEFMKSFYSL